MCLVSTFQPPPASTSISNPIVSVLMPKMVRCVLSVQCVCHTNAFRTQTILDSDCPASRMQYGIGAHRTTKRTIGNNKNNKCQCATVINAKRWNILFQLSNMTLYTHWHQSATSSRMSMSNRPMPMYTIAFGSFIRIPIFVIENMASACKPRWKKPETSGRFDGCVPLCAWPPCWALQLQPFNIEFNVIVDSSHTHAWP